MDRVRAKTQRCAHAPRQSVVHRSGGGWARAAYAVQHVADEFVSQLFAQWPLAGVLVKEQVALHTVVPHAHRQ